MIIDTEIFVAYDTCRVMIILFRIKSNLHRNEHHELFDNLYQILNVVTAMRIRLHIN